MTVPTFGEWLDSARTGPVPEPVRVPGDTIGQYWLSADDGSRYGCVHLWCDLCTAGGDDYLGEWAMPLSVEHEGEVSAQVREHQAEKHADTTAPAVATHEPWCCRSAESPCAKAGGCSSSCNCESETAK